MDQIDQKENFWPNQRAFHRAAIAISEEHKYHPIRETLNILQDRWMRSNKPIHLTRHWLNHLAGADDDPLIQQFAMLTLVAAVRRIRRPGCKFDEMLVLQSAQGTNKSSALELLSLNSEWFSDNFPLHERNNQRVQESLQGKWIVECSELDGYEKADDEHFKAMLSRQTDSVRPAYGRLIKDAPRQCIFIGTTNSIHFLRETCNRRIWPVIIKEFDLDALKAILHDLWGEAAHLESTGMSIRLDQTLWPAAAEQQEKHRLPDPWVSVLYAHLNNKTGFIQEVGAWDLLGVPPAQRRPSHNRRLYKVMKELGWHPIQHQFGSGFLKDTLDNYISVDVVDGVLPRTFRATQTTMPDALEEDIDIPNF
jgi:predicted P-loop ATPase